MDHHALLKGGANGPVQAVLEVELAVELHDVSEEIAVERRVVSQQGIQIESALGGGDLREAQLAGGHLGPIRHGHAVIGVRTPLAHGLEDHSISLGSRWPHRRTRCTRHSHACAVEIGAGPADGSALGTLGDGGFA